MSITSCYWRTFWARWLHSTPLLRTFKLHFSIILPPTFVSETVPFPQVFNAQSMLLLAFYATPSYFPLKSATCPDRLFHFKIKPQKTEYLKRLSKVIDLCYQYISGLLHLINVGLFLSWFNNKAGISACEKAKRLIRSWLRHVLFCTITTSVSVSFKVFSLNIGGRGSPRTQRCL